MADVTHYDVGETFERKATFKVDGVATDPTTVTAKVRTPAGAVTDFVYPSANLVRDAAGVFRLIGVATEVGRYYYRIIGTGTAAGVEEDYFIVDPSMFDLLVELDAYALTTIEDVEIYMDRVGIQGSKGSEAGELRFIASLINAKSDAIREYTRRQFKPTEDAVTKKFRYDGKGQLTLAPYELRNVTAVKLYTDLAESSWQTLAAQSATVESDYRLEPRQRSRLGTYLWLTLPRLDLAGSSARNGVEVSIAGDWGAGVVPAGVKTICEAEVAAEWQRATRRVQRDPETLETIEGSFAPFDLSGNSRAALDRYGIKKSRSGTLQVRA